jgi:hypothetical protein
MVLLLSYQRKHGTVLDRKDKERSILTSDTDRLFVGVFCNLQNIHVSAIKCSFSFAYGFADGFDVASQSRSCRHQSAHRVDGH